ncbi:LysM peptidoglycan-binding domain-containing protein [Microbacterium sp. YY-01]|uniref:LysM peptidoglycan-binding domain-containing protein n=1 Tax=Microbacterium sp. YY-01 TaxID=3421634 RepID=UPI003D17EAEC
MSTTTMSIAAPHSAESSAVASTTRLRLTQRGRRVVAALIALPLAAALAGSVLASGAALASADSTGEPREFATLTVVPGDTLWGIATEIAPERDPRDVVDEIRRLNLLPSGVLTVGQTISIPVE